MGNDGGSIPRRDELVKTKQKKEQVLNFYYFFKGFKPSFSCVAEYH